MEVFVKVIEPWHEISNNVVCATNKTSDSLRIRADWSEPLLVARVFYDCLATDLTSYGLTAIPGVAS